MERFNERTPIAKKELFEKFKLKYETVFNWLRVKHDKRDSFLRLLEQDYKDNVFDTCFEIRLEEIVWKCTDPSRKYWRTKKTISSRKRRTQLFESDVFKRRKNGDKVNYMGEGNFKNKILDIVRRKLIRNLGLRFEGRE
jgi:predicted adenine nucleotide alpha hydrolase (AANH) superfamily ATPase